MSKNEVSYLVTMLLFRKMKDESMLSQDDYEAINARMKQKYDLKKEICSHRSNCRGPSKL